MTRSTRRFDAQVARTASRLLGLQRRYDLRVLFEFTQHDGAEAILLLAIGTHDQVY